MVILTKSFPWWFFNKLPWFIRAWFNIPFRYGEPLTFGGCKVFKKHWYLRRMAKMRCRYNNMEKILAKEFK